MAKVYRTDEILLPAYHKCRAFEKGKNEGKISESEFMEAFRQTLEDALLKIGAPELNAPRKMEMPVLKCLRCGHRWYPRKEKLPKICGKCKSPYWNRKRTKRGRYAK